MTVLLQSSPSAAASLLSWYLAMGVDEALEVSPQPRAGWRPRVLSVDAPAQEEPKPTLPAPALSVRPVAALASQSEAMAQARALADAASSLETLRQAVESFDGCGLKKTATHTVFADGNPASGVMLVGEAPGAEEDKQGIPFCGASGQLLDRMLALIGLTRAEGFYITNTLFWRPPGNRQPTPEETELCRPFVEKHIALVKPRLLVLVGGTATKALLNDPRGITKLHGQIFSYSNPLMDSPVETHAIYHPSFLLRQPLAKRQAWADLLQIKARLAL